MPIKIIRDEDIESEAGEATMVVCTPVKFLTSPTPLSYKELCSHCGIEVWVHPSSPKKPPRVCIECAIADMRKREVTDPTIVTRNVGKDKAEKMLFEAFATDAIKKIVFDKIGGTPSQPENIPINKKKLM